MSDKVSIIIPIHNGEKYICKLVKHLQCQTYKNIEIILVENNSSDKSNVLCERMGDKYKNVKVIVSKQSGTSFARKAGTQNSTGKYILYMDQDDRYVNNKAIEEMLLVIKEDNSQICQFSCYKEYFGIFKRKLQLKVDREIYTREKLFADEIKGILGIKGSNFSVNVWSKIYDGDLLREVVNNVNESLVFAEDVYLNIFAFFNDKLEKVSVRNKAYYCWQFGVGFSSTIESGKALFKDYTVVKPLALKMLNKYKCNEEIIFSCLSETIWFHRFLVNEMILSGFERCYVEKSITEMGEALPVKQAKQYFKQQTLRELGEEFSFLTCEYTPEEYYSWCLEHMEKRSFKVNMANCLKKIIRWLRK